MPKKLINTNYFSNILFKFTKFLVVEAGIFTEAQLLTRTNVLQMIVELP